MPRSLWRKAVRSGRTRAFRTRSFGNVSSSPAVAVTWPSPLEAERLAAGRSEARALRLKRITPAAGAVLFPWARAERNAALEAGRRAAVEIGTLLRRHRQRRLRGAEAGEEVGLLFLRGF